MNTKKKVLIVDDSLTFSNALKVLIDHTSDMVTVGIARDGYEAIEKTLELSPDLITMDVVMSEMDGIEATKKIMDIKPTPIVIISSYLQDKNLGATFRALEAGALTIVNKPIDILSKDNIYLQKYVIDTIRTIASVKLKSPQSPEKKPLAKIDFKSRIACYKIIALGASTGGPAAYKYILTSLPENFPLPIVAIQHIANGFIDGFVEWLGKSSKLKVKIAEEGERLVKGYIYFPPDGVHMEVKKSGEHYSFSLIDNPSVNGFKPSISELFQSLAKSCPKETIAGLLTGIGEDGVSGLLAIHKAGGKTFTQDKESSVIYSMPCRAQSVGAANDMVSLTNIPNYLLRLLAKKEA